MASSVALSRAIHDVLVLFFRTILRQNTIYNARLKKHLPEKVSQTVTYKNTCTFILFFYSSDIDECSRCFINSDTQFFPFGSQTEDILSNLNDDGSTSILLSTGFVFYGTTYTTVFVSYIQIK